MSENEIPYREGEPPPGDDYILANLFDEHGNEMGLFWVRGDAIQSGPIQHKHIDELLPPIRWVWRHLKEYVTWCHSFEDWEIGFLSLVPQASSSNQSAHKKPHNGRVFSVRCAVGRTGSSGESTLVAEGFNGRFTGFLAERRRSGFAA